MPSCGDTGLVPCLPARIRGFPEKGPLVVPQTRLPHGLGYISPFSLASPMMGVCLSLLLRSPEQGRGCPALTAVLSLSE